MGTTRKMTLTKKRFAGEHREALLGWQCAGGYLNIKQYQLIRLARKEIGFSDKTLDIQIWRSLIDALR